MNDRLELLWDRYSRRLLAFIRSRVSDDADAEDILQELFIRVHRNLCCLPEMERHRPESWIYQIARHLIIDHYRRRREMLAIPDNLPAEPDLPEEDQRGKERERVDPQPAPGKEGTTEFDPGNRPRLPRSPGE